MKISIFNYKSFVISACTFVLFILIFSTSNIHSTDPFWNISRGIATFTVGIVFLVSISIFIFKVMFKRIKIFFQMLFGFLWSLALFILVIILTILSTCSYQNSLNGTSFQAPVYIRNTRIFKDYVGDQGALGFSGIGIYQDAPVFNSERFFKTKLLCTNIEKYDEISFEVLNDYQIKCIHEKGSTEVIDLPL